MKPDTRINAFIIALAFIPTVTLLWGCKKVTIKSRSGAELVTATVPWRMYSRADLPATKAPGNRFIFPLLEVYDSKGYLVYTGENSYTNADTLRRLVHGISAIAEKPSPHPEFALFVDKIPAFEENKRSLLDGHRPSVIIASLQDCRACSLQEHTVDTVKLQLLSNGINILLLKVKRP